MLYQLCYLFLMFFLYSVIGYLIEIINCSIHSKEIVVNRGFCLGPYLPIYGVSSIIMSLYLIRYQKDPIALFVMSALVCTIIEYFTSYILEKIFKARWWDYSEKKFNIEGRVCLLNATLFGVGGLACVYLINPFLTSILNLLPDKALIIISIILFVVFASDVIVTFITLYQVKVASLKFKNKDATSEISKVRQENIKNSTLIRHMLNAFPRIDIQKHKDPLAKVKAYLDHQKKKTK